MKNLSVDMLRVIARTCPFGIMVIDPAHKIVDINIYGSSMFEYEPEEMVGTDLGEYILNNDNHHGAATQFAKETTKKIRREIEHVTTYGITKSGRHCQIAIKIHRLDNGYAYAAFHDPSEYSTGDSLTHALSRGQFFIAVNKLNTKYSLLFIDLNKFKQVNDTLGHLAGDMVLSTIAKRMKNVLRESDLFCRYGGDEFVVVVPGPASSGHTVAKKIHNLVNELIVTRDGTVNISCSIGVAHSTEANVIDDLIHIADQRMYKEKAR